MLLCACAIISFSSEPRIPRYFLVAIDSFNFCFKKPKKKQCGGCAYVSSPQINHLCHVTCRYQNKLFGNLGLGSTCNIQLTFDGNPPTTQIRGRRGAIDTVPVFSNKETISGKIALAPVPGKRFEFQGVRVQLVGDVELASERGHPHEFLSLGGFDSSRQLLLSEYHMLPSHTAM